jgi:uncharacterized coiled-coil protein SlyX
MSTSTSLSRLQRTVDALYEDWKDLKEAGYEHDGTTEARQELWIAELRMKLADAELEIAILKNGEGK